MLDTSWNGQRQQRYLTYTRLFTRHNAVVDWDDAPETPKAFKVAVREAYDGVPIYAGKYDSEAVGAALKV